MSMMIFRMRRSCRRASWSMANGLYRRFTCGSRYDPRHLSMLQGQKAADGRGERRRVHQRPAGHGRRHRHLSRLHALHGRRHRARRSRGRRMSYWALCQTEPQREHSVRLYLMRARFETYAPRIRIKDRVALLFPTYVFVRIVDRWYPVRWTVGVTKMLMDGETPAKVPEIEVSKLRKK